MIDLEKLKPILEGYKDYFPIHWKDEKYKWEAIRHFQKHWDIEAECFGEMFKQATDRTDNLLASGYVYPRGMITNFARADDEFVRQMFRDLFDESRDLAERIVAFQTLAEKIRAKYDDGTWKKHYQNTSAISTYLWLMYPDKYYIYKYELYREVATELSSDYRPKRDGSVESMLGGFAMYDEICTVLQQDDEIRAMLNKVLSASCYADTALKTVTIDVGFYLCKFYLKNEYPMSGLCSKKITIGDWEELLNDASVFTPDALQTILRINDFSTEGVSFSELTEKYGGTEEYYHDILMALTNRIAEKKEYNLFTNTDDKKCYLPICCGGNNYPKVTRNNYLWNVVPELEIALKQMDFSKISLHERIIPEYSKEDFLSTVYMTAERYDVLENLLRYKLNVILQGAPGVGKTFTAEKLAYAMMGEKDDSRIEIVQFHQNYSYEDFVMGYRPDGVDFKLTEGVFYRFCKVAAKYPDKPYFFIVDEINRGNMSKIFGELLMLIEKNYRGTEVTLAYGSKSFSVPENLYIIGMMNTADRSLAMIDYALRRRFSFFEIEPGFGSDGFVQYQKGLANETFNTLIDKIKALNREIAGDKSLGRGFCIGHSYFCDRTPGECTIDWMRSVVEFDILPMLSEYWFDEPRKLQQWEKNLRGVFDDE